LVDKVWNEKHLLLAAWSVLRKDGAAGVVGQGCALLEAHLSQTVGEVSRLLQAERCEPRLVKRVWIDKLGSNEKRPLGIPTVRDRVVQTALAYLLEPILSVTSPNTAKASGPDTAPSKPSPAWKPCSRRDRPGWWTRT